MQRIEEKAREKVGQRFRTMRKGRHIWTMPSVPLPEAENASNLSG